jgi:hypothetical protein
MKKTTSLPTGARALARRLGLDPAPAKLAFTLSFHAPAQRSFRPPPYCVVVDTTKTPWLTVQHYNPEPRAVTLAQVRVPVEMTRFTVEVKPAAHRRYVTAWAKRLLEHGG